MYLSNFLILTHRSGFCYLIPWIYLKPKVSGFTKSGILAYVCRRNNMGWNGTNGVRKLDLTKGLEEWMLLHVFFPEQEREKIRCL